MIDLPDTVGVPVIRADFTSDEVWRQIQAAITGPIEDDRVEPDIDFHDEPALAGLTPDEITDQYPPDDDYDHPILLVFDATAAATIGHPLLVISLRETGEPRTFRTTPRAVQVVESNLTLATLPWETFLNACTNGTFDGF